MSDELKTTVINLKSLSQNIPDPVIVGAGDANGRTLKIIFTQEAAAQMTLGTKVYLSWHHQEVDIKGYNVFTPIFDEDEEEFAHVWEIKYPKSMLYEGNVLACIQLVDNVSIATSTNFMIHVLIDPNDGSRYTATDDFTEFQRAVISMTTLSDEMRRQMANQKIEFEDMQLEFMDVRRIANDAGDAANEAREIAEQSLQVAQNALNTIVDLTDVAREARDTAQEAKDETSRLDQEVEDIKERMDREAEIVEAINGVANSALEIARAIEDQEPCCGISEEEMNEAINNAKIEINQTIQETKEELESQMEDSESDFDDKINQAKEDMTAQYQALVSKLTITEF